jgi:hypothetical protein
MRINQFVLLDRLVVAVLYLIRYFSRKQCRNTSLLAAGARILTTSTTVPTTTSTTTPTNSITSTPAPTNSITTTVTATVTATSNVKESQHPCFAL